MYIGKTTGSLARVEEFCDLSVLSLRLLLSKKTVAETVSWWFDVELVFQLSCACGSFSVCWSGMRKTTFRGVYVENQVTRRCQMKWG